MFCLKKLTSTPPKIEKLLHYELAEFDVFEGFPQLYLIYFKIKPRKH